MARKWAPVQIVLLLLVLRRLSKRASSTKAKQFAENNGKYDPTPSEIIYEGTITTLRQSAIMTILTFAVWRPYQSLAKACRSNGVSERSFVCASATIVHAAVYWGMNSFFLLCDRRRWLEKYKLERTEAMGPPEELLRAAVKEAAVGQFVTGPPAFIFVAYPLAVAFGMPTVASPLPSFGKVFRTMLATLLFNEFSFYWVHRLFHHKRLYSWAHKQHHEFKGTIGFGAEHASPIEQAFANQLPAAAGFLFGGSHLLIFLVYVACRLTQVFETHSGYCFHGTWLHSIGLTHADAAAYHDFHHVKNSGNFGTPYLDYFFGTMEPWKQVGGVEGYVAQKREGVVGNVLNDIHPKRANALR